jgi:hypothetical protein
MKIDTVRHLLVDFFLKGCPIRFRIRRYVERRFSQYFWSRSFLRPSRIGFSESHSKPGNLNQNRFWRNRLGCFSGAAESHVLPLFSTPCYKESVQRQSQDLASSEAAKRGSGQVGNHSDKEADLSDSDAAKRGLGQVWSRNYNARNWPTQVWQ